MTPLKGESKTGIGYDVIVTQQCEVELSITAIENKLHRSHMHKHNNRLFSCYFIVFCDVYFLV